MTKLDLYSRKIPQVAGLRGLEIHYYQNYFGNELEKEKRKSTRCLIMSLYNSQKEGLLRRMNNVASLGSIVIQVVYIQVV